jgi:hypothetical protein
MEWNAHGAFCAAMIGFYGAPASEAHLHTDRTLPWREFIYKYASMHC